MTYRLKLIEVALPLEAINKASAREKSIRHGHPSTLHLWWARRPLAAARAVIFSQMVDDPSEYVDELLADPATRNAAEKVYSTQLKAWEARKVVFDKAHAAGMSASANPDPGTKLTLEETAANLERKRLFAIIEELVLWENTTNEKVLQQARDEIWRSWRRTCAQNADYPRAKELFNPAKLPAFHDPFAGGGALPLEAQRLGLEAHASDLNPVAVLINKAMIEIPPKFAGRPPVNPKARTEQTLMAREWRGAQGLAEDVRYYGQWMRDEAEKRIGHLYPKVQITSEMAKERPDLKKYIGQKLTVISWIWARTVKSPNPAFSQVDVPLASTFMLCTKENKEAYVEPVIENGRYRFTVKTGKPKDAEGAMLGTSAGKRAAFKCVMSATPIPYDYIRSEGQAGRMSARLMAIVAEGDHGRVYIAPIPDMETIALTAQPMWKPDTALPANPRDFKTPNYGLTTFGDLFTPRQLVALTTFSDLVQEAREKVKSDVLTAGLTDEQPTQQSESVQHLSDITLATGGTGAVAYADAVAVYLALSIDKATDYWSTINTWHQSKELIRNVFSRQAIPMTWDYTETNVFSESAGNVSSGIDWAQKVLCMFPITAFGFANLGDAQNQAISADKLVSTDPPYYDNIGYAELSDYFYIWLRRSLRPVFPDLFLTLVTPKAEELVATPYRHGSKEKAEAFFLKGMTQAMHRLAEQAHPAFPVTIYYAFKQAEGDGDDGTTNTGWDTFLAAVIDAGFTISGTWPMRTELNNRMLGSGTNALASSIILVCRKRAPDAPTATRREFITTLKTELPVALAHLQAGNIAPVDLAQAAIGPGMAIYTRYAKVLDAQGQPLSVRQALAIINQTLDEALTEQEGDFDADTRWALAWFEQSGFTEGEYGMAETLSKAKDTSVTGMVDAGILASSRGKVHLLNPAELPVDWDPTTDTRLTTWEMVHHLIRLLEASGESAAAELVANLGANAEIAHELCYRLYTICERKKRTTEALSYNGLVQSWPEIVRLARTVSQPTETQASLF
jgi:putative DNA methylase